MNGPADMIFFISKAYCTVLNKVMGMFFDFSIAVVKMSLFERLKQSKAV